MPKLARTILDGGQYLKVLPEINSYYMDYYPGLLTATLLNRKEYDTKSNAHRNQSNSFWNAE